MALPTIGSKLLFIFYSATIFTLYTLLAAVPASRLGVTIIVTVAAALAPLVSSHTPDNAIRGSLVLSTFTCLLVAWAVVLCMCYYSYSHL